MDYSEVSQHRSRESCWVILYDTVYDVTDFLPEHPGGTQIILKLAGQDATSQYDPVHPPGTLEENLAPSANKGKIDTSTLPATETPAATTASEGPPALDTLLNLDEIEDAAKTELSAKAWAYYSSAADDLLSKRLNNSVYSSILLRPRIFIDCTACDTSTTLFANPLRTPLYVAPAAMARLAHPDGEAGIARACAAFGAAQVISNNASMTPEQIVADAQPEQVFGWQLYVQTTRAKSEGQLARVNALPAFKFVVLTLDAPVPGKREDDERQKDVGASLPVSSAVVASSKGAQSESGASVEKKEDKGGVGRALFAGTAADLTWQSTLPWLAAHTKLPIVLKGIQTHEDAFLAAQQAPLVKGIILSNHGGRAADTAPPAVHTLLEIRKYCPEVFDKVDVFVDGGIRRGTDVVKALCLGAKAVGIGRAPLFGLGVGGQQGVERVFQILQEEIETCMRLLGVEKIEQLGLQHINTRALERDIYDGPSAIWQLGHLRESQAVRARARL